MKKQFKCLQHFVNIRQLNPYKTECKFFIINFLQRFQKISHFQFEIYYIYNNIDLILWKSEKRQSYFFKVIQEKKGHKFIESEVFCEDTRR